jgi:hypothetical protein
MRAKLRIFLTLMHGIFSDAAVQGAESSQKSKNNTLLAAYPEQSDKSGYGASHSYFFARKEGTIKWKITHHYIKISRWRKNMPSSNTLASPRYGSFI